MGEIHVAIIMDGNGRWASARGHARFFGHVRGAQRVREVIDSSCELGLGALTLYAFSTENWKRPVSEQTALWKILRRYLRREVADLEKRNVRLRVVGDVARLPGEVQEAIAAAESRLARNTGLQLTLALSYGARDEIVRAARAFARDCVEGRCSPDSLSEEGLSGLLDTAFLGRLSDVDLVIRTSGENRLSNFLLWQLAYAEIEFIDKPWPEFGREDLVRALERFSGRERRFGAVVGALSSIEMPSEVGK